MKNRLFLFLVIVGLTIFSACQKPVEVVVSTFPNGSKKLVKSYIINENDSTLVSITYFYKNGSIYLGGPVKDNLRNGLWKSWREDGTPWSEAEYSNDKEDGINRTFHENGELYYEGHYKDGKRVGNWVFYWKDGEKLKEIDYDNPVPQKDK